MDAVDLGNIPEPHKTISCQELLSYEAKVTHSGAVKKRSGLHKKWKKLDSIVPWISKYAVISEGCLYIFDSGTSKKPSTAISLYGYNKVVRVERDNSDHIKDDSKVFKLCHIQPKMTTFYFAVPSEREAKKWMAELKNAMLAANGKSRLKPTKPVARSISTASRASDEYSYGSIEESVYSETDVVDLEHDHEVGDDEDGELDLDYNEIEEEGMVDLVNLKRMQSSAGTYPLVSPKSASAQKTLPNSRPPLPVPGNSARKMSDSSLKNDSTSPTTRLPPPLPDTSANVRDRVQQWNKPQLQTKPHMPPGARQLPGFEPGGVMGLPPKKPSRSEQIPLPPVPTSRRPDGQDTPKAFGECNQPQYMEPRESENLIWDDMYWDDANGEGAAGGSRILAEIQEEGAFLIRDGSNPGEYTLCVYADHLPRKYKINYMKMTDKYYMKAGTEFSSIIELVKYYKANALPGRNCQLTEPYKAYE